MCVGSTHNVIQCNNVPQYIKTELSKLLQIVMQTENSFERLVLQLRALQRAETTFKSHAFCSLLLLFTASLRFPLLPRLKTFFISRCFGPFMFHAHIEKLDGNRWWCVFEQICSRVQVWGLNYNTHPVKKLTVGFWSFTGFVERKKNIEYHLINPLR